MGGACVGTEVRQGRVAGIVGLLALAVVLALSWMLQRPPTLVPSSAPAAVFSAQRAYADLQQIAGPEPTPIGSAGSDAVRDHIAAALSAAGFSVEMHTGVGSRTFHSTTVAGRVHNVVATWPGYDSTGQVLLAAHYDTTFGSPGASDDKASVAAMLETAGALASGERAAQRHRHDLRRRGGSRAARRFIVRGRTPARSQGRGRAELGGHW